MAIRHVGLMCVRNEADVLAEGLAHHAARFEAIVAIDGSDDGGRELLAACPQVVKLLRDENLVRPGERFIDAHRNAALQWIIEQYGVEGVWITLLHPDEFWFDEPRPMAEAADAAGATFLLWGEFRFFLHESDRGRLDVRLPIRDRVLWWGGPYYEIRQFRLPEHQAYLRGRHHCVLPGGLPGRCWAHIPRYRHYPYRSLEQIRAREADAAKLAWQPDHAGRGRNPWLRRLPAPVNSPLARWRHVEKFVGELPDPAGCLPSWWNRRLYGATMVR